MQTSLRYAVFLLGILTPLIIEILLLKRTGECMLGRQISSLRHSNCHIKQIYIYIIPSCEHHLFGKVNRPIGQKVKYGMICTHAQEQLSTERTVS